MDARIKRVELLRCLLRELAKVEVLAAFGLGDDGLNLCGLTLSHHEGLLELGIFELLRVSDPLGEGALGVALYCHQIHTLERRKSVLEVLGHGVLARLQLLSSEALHCGCKSPALHSSVLGEFLLERRRSFKDDELLHCCTCAGLEDRDRL